jgi:hypothetical protein
LQLADLKVLNAHLGEKVVSRFYNANTHRLIKRRTGLCWDIYEFLKALENQAASSETASRLSLINNSQSADQTMVEDGYTERLEVAEVSLRKVMVLVVELVKEAATQKAENMKLRNEVDELKRRQLVIDDVVKKTEDDVSSVMDTDLTIEDGVTRSYFFRRIQQCRIK